MRHTVGPSGRIVLLALCLAASGPSRSARAAGHLDPSFGTDGALVTPSGGQNAETGSRAVAIGSDGKIVALAAGAAGSCVVARYGPTGTLDPTFGVGGLVTIAPADPFYGIGVAVGGGKTVVVGTSERNGSPDVVGVVRLDASGALDGTFGSGGMTTTEVPGANAGANGWLVAIAADGGVVVAGRYDLPGLQWRAFVTRYDASGVLDPAYGSGGIAVLPIAETAGLGDIALQNDGGVVVVGGVGPENVPNASLLPYDAFYVVRLDPTGNPDAAFGSGGIVTGTIGGYFLGVAVRPDGAITAGGAVVPAGGTMQPVFERFLADGSPDVGFGVSGVAAQPFSEGLGFVQRVLLQPDGRIVGVGSHIKNWWRPVVVRLDTDGRLDPSFGVGGVSAWPFWDVAGTVPVTDHLFVNDAALAPDGGIVTADGMYVGDAAPPPAVRLHRFLGRGLPCTDYGTLTGARIALGGFGLPERKASISFKGQMDLPVGFPLADGSSTTFGLSVTDATGATVFEETVPSLNGGGMWRVSYRKSLYASLDDAAGIRRVRYLPGRPNGLRVQVKAKAVRYGVASPVLPLRAAIVVNRSLDVCAATTFVEGACLASSSRVKCR